MTTIETMQAPSKLAPTESDQMQCKKCSKQRKAFRTCATEYSEKTSIHGVKYLGEGDRPIWEKIFWILVFIISLYYCITMILNIWFKWTDSPFLVTFNERETRIFKIPFPAVTICPQIKTNSSIFRYDEAETRFLKNRNVTEQEKEYIAALRQVCGIDEYVNELPIDIDPIDRLEDVFLTPIMLCKWKTQTIDCDQLFRRIITDDGICYNFNGMDSSDIYRDSSLPRNLESYTNIKSSWNRYTGYESGSGIDTYPRRAFSGKNLLSVTLIVENDQKDTSCKISDGYNVLLHTPDNIPQTEEGFFRIPWGKKIIALISPTMLITPVALKSYSPEKRQCFFDDERYLQHFKLYTQHNCYLECMTNFTLKQCGCVHFSMPRVESTPVCNVRQLKCVKDASTTLHLEEFTRKVIGEEVDPAGCNCLPSCTHLEYDAETFESAYSLEKPISVYLSKDLDVDLSVNLSFAGIDLVFEDNVFLASKRTELYGIADQLSNWGGILGLFMGISVLSFMEIFYFSTLRLYSDYWIWKKQMNKSSCPHSQELAEINKTSN